MFTTKKTGRPKPTLLSKYFSWCPVMFLYLKFATNCTTDGPPIIIYNRYLLNWYL